MDTATRRTTGLIVGPRLEMFLLVNAVTLSLCTGTTRCVFVCFGLYQTLHDKLTQDQDVTMNNREYSKKVV